MRPGEAGRRYFYKTGLETSHARLYLQALVGSRLLNPASCLEKTLHAPLQLGVDPHYAFFKPVLEGTS
jgi:hypothetical protein